MDDTVLMTIGDVAARAGLRPSALRYYESVALVRPARRVNGRRLYDDSVFESLALIRLAQDAGFSIGEVKMLMHGFERATPASARWQAMAKKKHAEVVERIEQAQRMKQLLERLMHCQCETLGQCVRPRLLQLDRAVRRAS